MLDVPKKRDRPRDDLLCPGWLPASRWTRLRAGSARSSNGVADGALLGTIYHRGSPEREICICVACSDLVAPISCVRSGFFADHCRGTGPPFCLGEYLEKLGFPSMIARQIIPRAMAQIATQIFELRGDIIPDDFTKRVFIM